MIKKKVSSLANEQAHFGPIHNPSLFLYFSVIFFVLLLFSTIPIARPYSSFRRLCITFRSAPKCTHRRGAGPMRCRHAASSQSFESPKAPCTLRPPLLCALFCFATPVSFSCYLEAPANVVAGCPSLAKWKAPGALAFLHCTPRYLSARVSQLSACNAMYLSSS